MDNVSIVVHRRDVTGSRAAGRLRKSGLIPGVLYGHGKDVVLLSVEPHVLREALTTSSGRHAVLDVTFAEGKGAHKAIVKDLQFSRVKNTVTHIDLREIRLDQTIETKVAVRFDGDSKGVKAGGVLEQTTREVTVRGLVTAIPDHLLLDVSELDVNGTLKVSDLQLPEEIEVLDDSEVVLCSVLLPRSAVVEEEAEEGEEAAEAASSEPEIVGKKDEASEG